jgi:SAM-dependent methyltransferase
MPQFRDYFLDQTNENTRLLRQHEQIKALIGGLVPPEIDLSTINRALDLACGPGGWALDLARTYPQVQVVGVDASEVALGEARRLAIRDHLSNALFREVDLTSEAGLPFPDSHFDLVWARLLFGHLPTRTWELLLREVYRVLRPNRAFVAVDVDWMSGSFSIPEYERLKQLVNTLLIKGGRIPRFGVLGPALLRRIGFDRLWTRPMIYAFSFQQGDQPVPESIRRMQANVLGLIHNARTAILNAGLISAEEFDQLYEEAYQKIESDRDAVMVELLYTISGRKPG